MSQEAETFRLRLAQVPHRAGTPAKLPCAPSSEAAVGSPRGRQPPSPSPEMQLLKMRAELAGLRARLHDWRAKLAAGEPLAESDLADADGVDDADELGRPSVVAATPAADASAPLRQRLADVEASLADSTGALADARASAESARARLGSVEAELRAARDELARCGEQSAAAEAQLQRRAQVAEAELAITRAELAGMRALVDSGAHGDAAAAVAAAAEAAGSSERAARAVEAMGCEIAHLRSEVSELQEARVQAENALEDSEDEVNVLKIEMSELRLKIDEWRIRLARGELTCEEMAAEGMLEGVDSWADAHSDPLLSPADGKLSNSSACNTPGRRSSMGRSPVAPLSLLEVAAAPAAAPAALERDCLLYTSPSPRD